MEQHIFLLAENPVFQFFDLEIPYRTRVGPYYEAFSNFLVIERQQKLDVRMPLITRRRSAEQHATLN